MKFSKEISEVLNPARTLEDLVSLSGMAMVLYIDDIESSRAKTTVSPAGKVYSDGDVRDRKNDTLLWDNRVHAPVFSSDESVARCPVYADSNDSIDRWNIELPYLMLIKNVKNR